MQQQMEWSDEYATGFVEIDEQNQRVFRYLHALEAAIVHRSEDAIQEVVIDLLDYAVTHCRIEEQVMDDAGYPLASEHRQAHAAFQRRTEQYVRQLAAGDNPVHLAQQIRNDLRLWITGHIEREDPDYAEYIARHTERPQQPLLDWLFG